MPLSRIYFRWKLETDEEQCQTTEVASSVEPMETVQDRLESNFGQNEIQSNILQHAGETQSNIEQEDNSDVHFFNTF